MVALINAGDNHHERCTRVLRTMEEPLITVWPAFTEAMYLLGFSWHAQDALWELVDREVIGLVDLDAGNHHRIRELMKKYRDLPMDLADAALVSVAEREGIARIFTLDRKDFQLYRPHRIGRFQIIPGER